MVESGQHGGDPTAACVKTTEMCFMSSPLAAFLWCKQSEDITPFIFGARNTNLLLIDLSDCVPFCFCQLVILETKIKSCFHIP